MKYAIIAAGQGSRLNNEGISTPKPLVKIGQECMIDRLIRIFTDNDAEEIVVICNEDAPQVPQHLMDIQRDGLRGRPVPLRYVVKSTPSSMHSFFEISRYLTDAPFIMTTVDTVFDEEEFKEYVKAFRIAIGQTPQHHTSLTPNVGSAEGLMGVTSYVDDEKPLYVETDDKMNITAFLDAPSPRGTFPAVMSKRQELISAGIYGLKPSAVYTLNNCIARGERRMRNFQRALVADGRKLTAWRFGKVLDIDHADDIKKAEQWFGRHTI